MPSPARWTAALTLTLSAAAVCGPLALPAAAAHAAPAGPASLYAPTALVLSVGHGERAADATAERAVTLSCAPTPSGTHPAPAEACAELRTVDGDPASLSPGAGVLCTKEYDPVVVTVEGVWRGKRLSYERSFANPCVKNAYGPAVFAF
ncbi:subtilase-type protease inhibitor [Streptomyces griseoaurantiacus]|uniref:subtilase-type protease inhibitor n=1 Tax=Streptomyces griseoaurantiacus TaxID=68213 RepID=UPI0036749EF2